MKKLRRIISMLMVLVLFIGILPMNLGVVKAEAELDDSFKLKDIRARVYDGDKWEDLTLTAVVYNEEEKRDDEFATEFRSDISKYRIYLDPKYKKIQFNIKKNFEGQKFRATYANDNYKVDANDNGDIVTIRPGISVLSVTDDNNNYAGYLVLINKIGNGTIHELNVTSGSAEFYEAYEGDLVTIKADKSIFRGKVFDRWVKVEDVDKIIELEQDNDIIKELNKTPTELRMPNYNLRVKPIFKDSEVGDSSLRNIILYGLEDEVWKNQKSKLVFDKEEKTYTVNLGEDFSKGYVYVQFGESEQSISVTLNDNVVASSKAYTYNGYETEKLELHNGENIFKITVTSQDKKNTSVYTLIVNRGEVKYNVSFDAGEGSGEMPDTEIEKGKEFELPENGFTAPDGQEFKVWEVDGIEYPAKTKIKIDKKTIVKAIWKDIEYKVTFNKTEGSGEMNEKIVKAGEKYTLPENGFTAPDNKEFVGWKVGDDEKKPGETITVNEDTEVKALWKDIMLSVSFKAGEGSGSMESKKIAKGSTYELPKCTFTAPDNKEFKSWSVDDKEKSVGEEITIDGNIELTALWKEIQVKVSFNANQGSGTMKDVLVNKGSKYTLPACDFTAPTNKEFKAWEVNGKEKAVGDVITINDNTEITATWRDKPIEKYKVTLVANNGTNETKEENIEKGKEYTLPECKFTEPENKVFKAWQIADKEYKPQDKIKIDGETIVRAIWQVKSNKTDPDKPNPGEEKPDEDNPGDKPNQDKPNQDKPKPFEKHAINITPSPYGEVIIDPPEAKVGDKVTVRAIANYGYELLGLSVHDASGKLLPIINGEFLMPDGEVDIYPIFREIAPYIEPETDDKAEREEQKRRDRRNYYHEEEKDEDEVKTIDKAKEEKQKESKVLITIGSEILDKVDGGVRTLKAMDTKPYIKGGRTMLPLRYISEALGYRVAWLSETRTAVIMDIGLRVEIPVDSNFIIVNGVKYTSDVKPEMRNNRIMLPIANIARALGLKDGKDILWDEVNRQVTLTRNFNTK